MSTWIAYQSKGGDGMMDVVYEKYVFGFRYPIINLKEREEKRLRNILSELYGFNSIEIRIETFYDKHSRRPYFLDNNNHYLLFKVKKIYFLSIDGNLELLGEER